MNDITITLPLSLLSFLVSSGFWVVYLYIGLLALLGTVTLALRNAVVQANGRKIVQAWRDDTRPLAIFVLVLFVAWPAVLAWLVWRVLLGD